MSRQIATRFFKRNTAALAGRAGVIDARKDPRYEPSSDQLLNGSNVFLRDAAVKGPPVKHVVEINGHGKRCKSELLDRWCRKWLRCSRTAGR